MSTTAEVFSRVAADLRDVLGGDVLAGLSDADRAEVLRALGEVGRLTDAAIVETVATAEVEFGHRYGCRNMNELLQRALLTDTTTAAKFTRAAAAVQRDVNLVSRPRWG